tara:strand:+ start:19508 stop:20422 length:915 start_codon:yes stop_codon:yes gene_type:complete
LKHPQALTENTKLFPLLRIHLTYLARHGRLPNLTAPTTFTELVQLRKLHDRNPKLPILADKVAVKDIAAKRLGPEWITPTLWSGTQLPETSEWRERFVLKSRHGCNQIAFVDPNDTNWAAVRRRAHGWVKKTYGFWLDEWLYRHIPHGLLIEPFIGQDGGVPVDYKFYVFGGEVAFIQVHLGRGNRHRWILFDQDWCRVSALTADADPKPPRSLDSMVEAAELLGSDIDFARVDLYEPAGSPVFGEMTFYPGSGLDPFNPVGLDAVIGAHWLRALDIVKKEEVPRTAEIRPAASLLTLNSDAPA